MSSNILRRIGERHWSMITQIANKRVGRRGTSWTSSSTAAWRREPRVGGRRRSHGHRPS